LHRTDRDGDDIRRHTADLQHDRAGIEIEPQVLARAPSCSSDKMVDEKSEFSSNQKGLLARNGIRRRAHVP